MRRVWQCNSNSIRLKRLQNDTEKGIRATQWYIHLQWTYLPQTLFYGWDASYIALEGSSSIVVLTDSASTRL